MKDIQALELERTIRDYWLQPDDAILRHDAKQQLGAAPPEIALRAGFILYQSVALLRRYHEMTDEQMDEQRHADLDWLEKYLS